MGCSNEGRVTRRPVVLRRGRGGRGQTLVEFMLVLPVFLLMVFGIMDLGIMAFYSVMLNHAAFEAARIFSMTEFGNDGTGNTNNSCSNADATAIITRVLPNAKVSSCVLQATTPDPQAQGVTDRDVIIQADYPVQFLFPLSMQVLGAACPNKSCGATSTQCCVSSTVRMPVEQPRPFSGS